MEGNCFRVVLNGFLLIFFCDITGVGSCIPFPLFSAALNYAVSLQDNYNALHIAAMYSREDIVKILLTKKGVDPFASGGVSNG